MKKSLLLTIKLSLLTILSSCTPVAPPCPNSTSTSEKSPSAGCFSLYQGKLLVVEDFKGQISIPGGSSLKDENSRCAAYRETWEETGLETQPKELIRQFENGFHLYHCELTTTQEALSPPFKMEIKRAFWLATEDFPKYQWRFPEQMTWLAKLIQQRDAQTTSKAQ